MGLRLDLDNKEDAEFLRKRLGSSKLSELRSDQAKANDGYIASIGKDLQSDDRSSSIDNSNKPKRSKYGNQKVFCNTLQKTIDSLWEHDLYHMFKALEDRGIIRELKHQSHHNLFVNDKKICRIELDYEFIWLNKKIYADAKSEATSPPIFKLKAKLFTALMNEPIYLIERDNLGIYEKIAYASSNTRN
jgi:hypothetical protein